MLLVVLNFFFSTFFFSFTLFSFISSKSHKLSSQHFITSPLYISPSPAMETTDFRRKSALKTKMNKGFIAEDLDDDMEEEEEEGVGDHGFPDDEKKKKAYGKRGSSGGAGVSPPSCQVEKCGLDLSDAKRYHRRHKVCEIHAKAPFVVVAGLRQRFCQQCSRFHELSEFDEAKRSCRRRLAGHNERRRKSSAESSTEGSSRKGMSSQLRESQCRQADDQRARVPIAIPGNSSFKRSQNR
ncbi:hypothetical protein QUC31_002129 [Theobroma cacao]|uniref:Squamosa promoter-binding-like protein 4 n=1 Tax=Theobroma cacao TaxID=3641 RepID=A0AB32WQ23_THECC|nr:PREDICTED: squamosa promoter-binding-like protein 4 [Theobroma cacao]